MTAPTDLHDESAARRELAACYRLFDHLGWSEAIFNHITLRVPSPPGTAHYLINPFGRHYCEVSASNLVKIDIEGNDIDGTGREVNRAGFVIHGAIHQSRPDAHCVMHIHTTAGCAVSCKESGLRHDNFYSAMLYGDIGYHEYEGVSTNLDERPRLVRSLGERNHLVLRNHGLLAVGGSVAQCFQRLWTLQRACEIQLASDAGAGPNREIQVRVLEKVPASRLKMHDTASSGGVSQLMFDAMLRRAGIVRESL
ncbi:MAG: class II aldolase/adducin family protein [Ramlibacter sp.]|nr:class II aldolase/adducin family protein [Ramlibacter sp.]